MSDIAIRVENLSKQYRIGAPQVRYKTIRESLTQAARAPFRRLSAVLRGQSSVVSNETIWALKDVSFEVKRGEVVGIIGRNGAGKTTLLKVLSRITEPTEGRVRLRGRVGSLLEVGTGFHPELTGRENTYLNGAILGMRRAEIDGKFDEIVDFSGVGKFIDTPVKRYSSGMRVRLAFSVAAHLEPEILLIDEVLAVGDTAFQKKCIGKMQEVSAEGRTVLFVSHSMHMVQSLCSRAILLENGSITANAPVAQAINMYLESIEHLVKEQALDRREDRKGGQLFRFTKVEFSDLETTAPLSHLISGQPVMIRVHYVCSSGEPLNDVVPSISFFSRSNAFLFACRSDAIGATFRVLPGEGSFVCRLPKFPLSSGRYSYNLIAYHRGAKLDWIQDAGFIDLELGDYYGTGILPGHTKQGVFVDFDWDRQLEKTAG